jgi:general nucleoside transport system permease protein
VSPVQTLFTLGIALMVPMLFAALGELIIEKSGVLNVGIEGVLLIGAFGAAVGVNYGDGSIWIGLLVAIGAGLVCGIVLALLYVRLGTDQIVTGIMFNILAFGLTTTLAAKYVHASQSAHFPDWKIPVLHDIPGIGNVLFDQDLLVYGSIVVAALAFYLTRRTWFGLYARAASEFPSAAESAGLNVWRLRYVAVIIGCVLTAVGGAELFANSGGFVAGYTNGRGFIALAIVVLARWNPLVVVAASLLFGVAQALQFEADKLGFLSDFPPHVLIALPYILVLAAVVFARGSRYPAAVGIPFRPTRSST